MARLTVLSANSLIDDSICSQFGDAVCNLTVYMNTLTTAFSDTGAISIPSKSLETATNTVTSAGVWSMLYLAVLPLGRSGDRLCGLVPPPEAVRRA